MRGYTAIGIRHPALGRRVQAPPGTGGIGAAGHGIVEAALVVTFEAVKEREGSLLDDQGRAGARWIAGEVAHYDRVGPRVSPSQRSQRQAGLGRTRDGIPILPPLVGGAGALGKADRSEERRVGKECRSRWSPDH